MAISPASDIILDVARAADPQKAMATTRALAGASAEASGAFAATLDGLPAARTALPDFSYRAATPVLQKAETPQHKAEIGLESMLLKSFVDQMLPKDAADVFGSGVAGDVWRSMLSEKIADQIAKSGALKIGERLFATHKNLLHSTKHAATTA